jgi:hypothetical protein
MTGCQSMQSLPFDLAILVPFRVLPSEIGPAVIYGYIAPATWRSWLRFRCCYQRFDLSVNYALQIGSDISLRPLNDLGYVSGADVGDLTLR